MKILKITALLFLVAPVASAQTTATPTSKYAFSQIAPTLDVANSLVYRERVDGAIGTPLLSAVCTGSTSPFACTAPIPAKTAASHSVTLSASNEVGESAQSGAIVFTMQSLPPAPSGGHMIAAMDLFPLDTWLSMDDGTKYSDPALRASTFPARTLDAAIVLKFGLPLLPPGTTVTSATLFMTLTEAEAVDGLNAGYRVSTHKLTGPSTLPLATGATSDGVTPWRLPLAQSDISAFYTFAQVNRNPTIVKMWDMKRMVQEWIDNPATNLGMVLNGDTTASTGIADHFRSFASMEAVNPTTWPYLRVVVSTP